MNHIETQQAKRHLFFSPLFNKKNNKNYLKRGKRSIY